MEGLKDKFRSVIRVGMVDGRYTIFAQVKSAAEALDFELWRSRRKNNTTGSSTTWQATKSTTGGPSSGAANHNKTGRYPVQVKPCEIRTSFRRRIQPYISPKYYVLIVVNPPTWPVPVLTRKRTGARRLMKTSPPGGPCGIRG